MNYENKNTGEVISESDYLKLSYKANFTPCKSGITHSVSQDDSGNFLLSLIIAEATGSVVVGAVVGGDFLGAIVGSELSESTSASDTSYDSTDSSSNASDSSDFGGSSSDVSDTSSDF